MEWKIIKLKNALKDAKQEIEISSYLSPLSSNEKARIKKYHIKQVINDFSEKELLDLVFCEDLEILECLEIYQNRRVA